MYCMTETTGQVRPMTVAGLLERFADLPPTSVVHTAAGSMTTFAGLPEKHRQHADGITLRPGAKIPASVAAMSASLKQAIATGLAAGNSPVYSTPSGPVSFLAVTDVMEHSGKIYLRVRDLAPVQGPSILRFDADETYRRMLQLEGRTDEGIRNPNARRYLANHAGREYTDALRRRAEVRAQIQALQDELPKLDASVDGLEFIIGIRDAL